MSGTKRVRLAALFICIGIVLTACHRNPEARKRKYFDSAISYLKQGKPAKAVLELRNALRIDPNFVEAANVLAEILARGGNYHDAFTLLEGAEKARPDYLPVHQGLAQLYRLDGKLSQAEDEANFILQRTPDDTGALFTLGTIQAAQKKYADATGSFSRILEIQPNDVKALLALASVEEKSKNDADAERYLKLAMERNPRSDAVYLALLQFYIARGRRADAEALFPQALRLTANNVQILSAEAGFYEGSGDLARAESVVKQIQASHPANPAYESALADFYVRTGNLPKARAELERVLALHKNDRGVLHKLIEVRLNLNELSGARQLNDALLKTDPKDSYARLFHGRLLLAQGDTKNALAEFDQTQKFQPDYPALYYWYAQAYLQRHEWPQARQYLQTALKLNPAYTAARLQLADLENQMGASDAALYDAKHALLANPADTRAMLLYSQALIQKQQYADAGKAIDAAARLAPDNPNLHRQRGILALVNKDEAAAQKEFQQALSLNPRSKPLLEAVLLGFTAEKHTAAAADFLQQQIKTRPNDPLLYHEQAQVLLLLGKQKDAISALQKALALAPDRVDSLLLLAQTYADANQPGPAARLAEEALQNHGDDSGAMLRAGIVFEQVRRFDQAQKAYEKAVQDDSGNAIAKNNLAWLLVSHGGNKDVALSLAQQAKEKLPDNLQVTATLGWIYYQEKAYQTALHYLKPCAEKDRRNASLQYRLGMVYSQLGDADDARRSLLNALTLDPHFPEAAAARQALSNL